MERTSPHRKLVFYLTAFLCLFIFIAQCSSAQVAISNPLPKTDSVHVTKARQSFIAMLSKILHINYKKHKHDSLTIKKTKSQDSVSKKGIKQDTARTIPTKSCSCNPIPRFIQSGQAEVGYEYGLLPFYVPGNYPSGGFVSNGEMAVEAFRLPLNVTYFYSTFQGIPGLNNYFRVAFDANRFRQQMLQEMQGKESALLSRKDSLTGLRKTLMEKMYFLGALKNQMINPNSFTPKMNTNVTGKNSFNSLSSDTSGMKNNIIGKGSDSLKSNTQDEQPSLAQANKDERKAKDSLRRIDSLESVYAKRLEEVEKMIEQTDKRISQYDKATKQYDAEGKQAMMSELSPAKKFFATTDRFEVGMVYPSFSTFMVNGLPLNGILLEKQDQDFYFAATAGVTVNNLLMSNNALQNNLALARNLYNFFDFGNVSSGRRVVAVKTGYGMKDGTHLYMGYMRGWGLISYMDSTYIHAPNNKSSREQNEVVEIDGKIKIGNYQSISAVVAKSLVYPSANDSSKEKLLDFSYHSLAGFLQYKGVLTRTGTTLTLTTRYVQPLFYSFGVGFFQPDHLRYEARVDQVLGSKIKISIFYRTEVDNLDGLLPYTNKLNNAGATLSLKLSKHLIVKATYNPVLQDVTSPNGNLFHNRNDISQVNITHTIIGQRSTFISNLYYSYYRLNSGDTAVNLYTNAGYSGTLQAGKSRWVFAANYFDFKGLDTSGFKTILLSGEATFIFFKKLQLTGGLKYSISNMAGDPLGWKLQIDYLIGKCLSFSGSCEKPVIGDFYNNYPLYQINKFPYFCTIKMGYTFH